MRTWRENNNSSKDKDNSSIEERYKDLDKNYFILSIYIRFKGHTGLFFTE
jgi:hypothetical protein